MACPRCVEVLAESRACKIERSRNGDGVEISSGGLSIRLNTAAFLEAAWTFEEAAMKVAGVKDRFMVRDPNGGSELH